MIWIPGNVTRRIQALEFHRWTKMFGVLSDSKLCTDLFKSLMCCLSNSKDQCKLNFYEIRSLTALCAIYFWLTTSRADTHHDKYIVCSVHWAPFLSFLRVSLAHCLSPPLPPFPSLISMYRADARVHSRPGPKCFPASLLTCTLAHEWLKIAHSRPCKQQQEARESSRKATAARINPRLRSETRPRDMFRPGPSLFDREEDSECWTECPLRKPGRLLVCSVSPTRRIDVGGGGDTISWCRWLGTRRWRRQVKEKT